MTWVQLFSNTRSYDPTAVFKRIFFFGICHEKIAQTTLQTGRSRVRVHAFFSSQTALASGTCPGNSHYLDQFCFRFLSREQSHGMVLTTQITIAGILQPVLPTHCLSYVKVCIPPEPL